VKRSIPITLIENDDGSWTAEYRTEATAGSVSGSTPGEAADKLVAFMEKAQGMMKELLEELQSAPGQAPTNIQNALAQLLAGKSVCICGECDTSPQDDSDNDPTLN
jgi:hypothetical protein